MRLGAVADDVTGACDLAGRVAAAGLPATIFIGVPAAGALRAGEDLSAGDDLFPGGADGCAVVGLKIRTAPVADAARAATDAGRALLDAGATLLYQKYCSTFDSTAVGNIGPVGDALARLAGERWANGGERAGNGGERPGEAALTVGTPATPAAGRTQYASVLFVHGTPLAESPMHDHPLTPMRDSNVVRLLGSQTPQPVSGVPWQTVREGSGAVLERVGAAHGHVLVDALDEHDLDVAAESILALAERRPVVAAGAAGLGTALACAAIASDDFRSTAAAQPDALDVRGRLIVAGSASAATRAQVAAFAGEQHTLDPLALADGDSELDRVKDALGRRPDHRAPVLVRAQNDPEQVTRAQRILGAERAAELIEHALTEIAAFAVRELGYSHVLVAGGETSGAVVAGLGVDRLTVGRQAAPGVPWTIALSGGHPIALLLKSGNFGADDLFTTAWEVAP